MIQSVKDALADAEQLRIFLKEGVTRQMEFRASGLGAKHVTYFAVFGQWGIDGYGGDGDILDVRFPHSSAALRATQAFRAVPALRGEQ